MDINNFVDINIDDMEVALYKEAFPDANIDNVEIIYLKNIPQDLRKIYIEQGYSEEYINTITKLVINGNFAGATISNNNLNIQQDKVLLFNSNESTIWHELTHVDDFRRFISKNGYNNLSYEEFIQLPIFESFLFFSEIKAHYIGMSHALDLNNIRANFLHLEYEKPDINYFAKMLNVMFQKMDNANQQGYFEGYLHALAEFLGIWIAIQEFWKLEKETEKWFLYASNGVYKNIYDFALLIKSKKSDELTNELDILQQLYEIFINRDKK